MSPDESLVSLAMVSIYSSVVRSGLDGRVHSNSRFDGYVGSVDAY